MKHLTSDQLLSYQQKKLSNKESLLLEQHLNECISCQAELELLNELDKEWMNPPEFHFSDDLVNEIMKQTESIQITEKTNENKSKTNSKKVRLIHLVLAAAATFLFFQFQLTERITNSNRHVVQTIDQTSSLIEKSEEIKLSIPIPKILKGNKK
ncbi:MULTISPECIES: hypothetical protein [unclassified Bacillus (in: firmicutes)]|uniref:hypothetical protein n=1 Tax=unclassified Bacillus (in: firmicutes) TaxID=185979 RepID=UPI0008E53D8B|nr:MULTISPECIES: hypothetical protein [unclassified Bacillus (in: firmicutes)]PGZ92571.1 hypothetical protein COE53_10850 [Bacillus sp. AFS029533]SFC70934.1 hypothetical protein SAMN02799633_01403 [Bacillus sp. UNCCL81]